MTRHNRLIRAVHAGMVCWMAYTLLGIGSVSLVEYLRKFPKWLHILGLEWINRQPSTEGALVIHHMLPIAVVNLLIAAVTAFLVKLLLEYQHERDLKEKSRQ